MHSTDTRPRTISVPSRDEIAAARANLLALDDHTANARNAFLVAYLRSLLCDVADSVIDMIDRTLVVKALAHLEANAELSAEEDAFYTPRSDTSAFDPTTVPHEGIKCGRYAR